VESSGIITDPGFALYFLAQILIGKISNKAKDKYGHYFSIKWTYNITKSKSIKRYTRKILFDINGLVANVIYTK